MNKTSKIDRSLITVFLFFLIISSSSNGYSQVNHFDSSFYGFEDLSGWYFQPNNNPPTNWTIDNNIVYLGNSSAKFSASNWNGNDRYRTRNGALINLPVGDYVMKLRVWLEPGGNLGSLNFIIKTPVWKQLSFNLSGIETGKWVELSKNVNISQEVVDDDPMLSVVASSSSSGTFYVDAIEMWGEALPDEVLPASSLSYSESLNKIPLNLSKGVYDVKMKVFKESGSAVKSVYSLILDPWLAVEFDISQIPFDQWTEVSTSASVIEDIDDSKLRLFVPKTSENGGGVATLFFDDLSFSYTGSLNTNDISSSDVIIYPNPATQSFNVKLESLGTVTLLSLNGKEVRVYKSVSDINIPTGHLASGLYLVMINQSGNKTIKKVMVD